MSIFIRNAKPEEAKLLSALAMRSKAKWGYSNEFMEACRDELSVLPNKIESPKFHYSVAITESQIIGFYALERLSKKEFELEALFVEPDYIGTGVGRALISHAKNLVLSKGGYTIIIQGDPNASHFYQAAGGVHTGTKESGSIPGRYLPIFEIKVAG